MEEVNFQDNNSLVSCFLQLTKMGGSSLVATILAQDKYLLKIRPKSSKLRASTIRVVFTNILKRQWGEALQTLYCSEILAVITSRITWSVIIRFCISHPHFLPQHLPWTVKIKMPKLNLKIKAKIIKIRSIRGKLEDNPTIKTSTIILPQCKEIAEFKLFQETQPQIKSIPLICKGAIISITKISLFKGFPTTRTKDRQAISMHTICW